MSEEFFGALVTMLQKPWQPLVLAGFEPCRFCRFSQGVSLQYREIKISMGNNNLFVPDNGHVFVAPSTIAHYIDSHEYQPPSEFQAAVLRLSKLPRLDYFKEMKAHFKV